MSAAGAGAGVAAAIRAVEAAVGDPRRGLPEEVFLFASRITPMVNVDLLVANEAGETLLTWRDDGYWKPGWHLPGGIIRFQESMAQRVREVARTELGAEVDFAPLPAAVHEFILPDRRNRGHFVSLLFRCRLLTPPDPALRHGDGPPAAGQWRWHAGCPEDLLAVHGVYRPHLGAGGGSR